MPVKTDSINVFGVRHLSPAASWHLQKYLERIKPEAILIEGPSDASEWITHLVSSKTRPPVALLAYTNVMPVQTVLYPFSAYSPEYVAALWGKKNRVRTEFIDLPCSVYLGFKEKQLKEEQEALPAEKEKEDDTEEEQDESSAKPVEHKPERVHIYEKWAELAGYDSHDAYWEAEFEHNLEEDAYLNAAYEFGKSMRAFDEDISVETLSREAYMRRKILEVVASGIEPEKIVVVTGAFHASVLNLELPTMTDEEFKKLPKVDITHTLMPYSNLRLSSRTGYGAGNTSPKYFSMMWESINQGKPEELPNMFFTAVARYMREEGTFRSTAEVIEAVRLSQGLAALRKQSQPTIEELRLAAITCLGQGEVSVVSRALAATEVGTEMGELEEGVSRTAIQDDFYKLLSELKLDKYKSTVAQELTLDLRENRNAKSESSRWLDLTRSYFLNRLKVLRVSFAKSAHTKQDTATWKEVWGIQWTTEAEIELVESSLMGETVETAAAYAMKQRLDEAKSVAHITTVIELAALCGIPSMLDLARKSLAEFTVDSDSFPDIASAIGDLSSTMNFGDIRRMDTTGLIPLLSHLFLRCCLILIDNSHCNHQAALVMFEHIHTINKAALDHYKVVDEEAWLTVLRDAASRDDISPAISGFACAILLERNLLCPEELEVMVLRRLSPGIDADLGIGWFEGLATRNHYGLLSRAYIWELLERYVSELEDESFTKALVFLRRTFSSFSPQEKRIICDNLGEIWQIGGELAENKLSAEYTEEEKQKLESLNDFDFDDL